MKKYTGKRFGQLNNRGMTLVEMITTFALIGIFMVAATRMISYVIGIYYAASGNSYGLQVSGIISSKVIGQIEGACNAQAPVVSISENGIGQIYFADATGSYVTITAQPLKDGNEEHNYLTIHYDPVTEGTIKYDAVDWRFDPGVYMGYYVKNLEFENPGADYPENVLRMILTLHHERYGDYVSTYYMKCSNVEEIQYK